LQQIESHLPHLGSTLYILIDLTTLSKTGKFQALSNAVTPSAESQRSSDPQDEDEFDPWVRVLNGKRGLHVVMLYLVIGEWRVPWGFKIWRGQGTPSPNQFACKLLATVPQRLTQRFQTVVVLADTEFGTPRFVSAVRQRQWRPVVGIKGNRQLVDGRSLKDLYRNAKRGCQVRLVGFDYPLTISWFWLKRAEGKRALRFVASTYPYSGAYLVRLGRRRWAIEGFFKTVKHRFGFHRFGQSTHLGVYRWLILSLKDWGEASSNFQGGRGAPATEGDATWIHRFYKTQFWTHLGGDFSPTASAIQTVGDVGSYTWGSTPEMVADVQAWLDSPTENFGWLPLGNETAPRTVKGFAS
jgi:hypothetical protein